MNQFFACPSLRSPFPEASTVSLHSMRWQYRDMTTRWNRRLNCAHDITRFIVRLSEYIEIMDPTDRGTSTTNLDDSRHTRFIRPKFGQEDEAGGDERFGIRHSNGKEASYDWILTQSDILSSFSRKLCSCSTNLKSFSRCFTSEAALFILWPYVKRGVGASHVRRKQRRGPL